jgi:hypothetical protein
MDLHESPAVARHRLRLALRKLSAGSGLNQGEIAKRLKWSLSKVNRILLGEVTVSNTDLQALMRLFNVTDPEHLEELSEHCDIARKRGWWWDEKIYRDHVTAGTIELLQFEGDARAIHAFTPQLIPGLLQTRTYAEEVLNLWPNLSEESKKLRLDFRMRLKEHVFDRPAPPRCVFLLDESVVNREVGGPKVMYEQLRAVLADAGDDRIQIRILPLVPFAVLAADLPFSLLKMADDDHVLYREYLANDELVDNSQPEVEIYRGIVEQMLDKALKPAASLRLIEARVAALHSALDRL